MGHVAVRNAQEKSIKNTPVARHLCENTRSCSKFRNTMSPSTRPLLVISTYQVISPRISLSELLLLLLPTLSSIHPGLACCGSRGGGRRGEILRGTGRPHRCSIADSECRGRGRRGVVAKVVVVKRSGSRHYTMMCDGCRSALLLFLLFLDDGRCARTATCKHIPLNISKIPATEPNVLSSCDICVAVPTSYVIETVLHLPGRTTPHYYHAPPRPKDISAIADGHTILRNATKRLMTRQMSPALQLLSCCCVTSEQQELTGSINEFKKEDFYDASPFIIHPNSYTTIARCQLTE